MSALTTFSKLGKDRPNPRPKPDNIFRTSRK